MADFGPRRDDHWRSSLVVALSKRAIPFEIVSGLALAGARYGKDTTERKCN